MEKKLEFPKGKFMSTVKVGEKGQIVIPKGAREIFNVQPGDTLLLMADEHRGIAIVPRDFFDGFINAVTFVDEGEEK